VEPLEATSICTSILQIRSAQRWIETHDHETNASGSELEAYNQMMKSYTLCNSIFIAWHYACGSRWDTAFWRHARQGIDKVRRSPEAAPYLEDMIPFVEAGRALPGLAISRYANEKAWQQDIYPLMKLYTPFGNFSELNFAQVGHGIGFYKHQSGHYEVPPLAV
jgi:hypothetical protein